MSNMKPVLSKVEGSVRCAIYTRKSSEEGLEQSFNSLDAQREACAAYILSQASERWSEVPDLYDDGGLSGGTLERPALQRLLADVAAGRIDIIVVYKVDRLTRSLLDFAKLVEAFDAAGTSFVSVTQSFNTTTSMGRLTLNMLLSFAQFEREVTAERIRDKIAASKARGMWMGGIPPLGYKPDGRSLTIVEEHANLVRHIYERYLALGNVRHLATELEADRLLAPHRTTATGKQMGGVPFSRGQLYLMLKCRTYLGEIEHKDKVYPGLHQAIITRPLWDEVQAKLASNVQGRRSGAHVANASLLAGIIVDEAGDPLVPVHATKGKVRYRYYISRALQTGDSDTGLRMPAREIEAAVCQRLAEWLSDPVELLASGWLDVRPDDFADAAGRITRLAEQLEKPGRDLLRRLVTQVQVTPGGLAIICTASGIAEALELASRQDTPATLTLIAEGRLTRTGKAMRLVHDSGRGVAGKVDSTALRLLVQAHRYWRELRRGEVNISALAAQEGVSSAYITRVLRLAFLAPKVIDAILAGRQRAGVDGKALLSTGAIEADWKKQHRAMLPAAG